MRPAALAFALLVLLAAACPAAAATSERPWPPRSGPGHLFVHFGEEHWNDPDGLAVLTRVVEDTIRYRPDLVTMSGDKVDDGTAEQLERWKDIMSAYDRAGVPYMAAVGNHDGRQRTPESVTEYAPGSTPLRDIEEYLHVFASRPYPMGDGPPYPNARMAPRARPADDPDGAATHFWVDFGSVRFVFLDSSCYGIRNCDAFQNPPDGRGREQFDFLREAAREANAEGRTVLVVTHMATRDPRDQRHSTAPQVNHVMGKGISPDNQLLELEAERLGVDAVLVAHIKGQWQYRGVGDIPYYIDGGAGGELYTSGPVGVDHGYWYGWRLLRVDGSRLETDVVPVIVPGGIRVEGPQRLEAGGAPVTWQAFARQPATKSHRGIVESLELRDPAPIPRSPGAGAARLSATAVWLAPLLLVALLAAGRAAPGTGRPARRRRRRLAGAAVPAAMLLAGGAALAQQSVPTDTRAENLPNPARIFRSSDPLVLAPVPSDTDDPRRDAATQTADGRFRPRCPGRVSLSVTSGFERAELAVHVAGAGGPVVRSVRRGPRVLPAGAGARRAASVRLAQPAVVEAVLRRGRRTRRLSRACLPAGAHRIAWDGSRVRPGRFRLELRVLSDRRPVVRRWRVRVR